jgi:hypothetical protein
MQIDQIDQRTPNLYFQTRDQPRAASDLPWREECCRACINYRWTESGVLYQWPFSKAGEQVGVEVTGPLTMNDIGLTVEAALSGLGVACTLGRSNHAL